MSSEANVLSLRLDPRLKKQLDKLAKATQRSRSFLAAEAIREYVSLNEWQVEEISKALVEADRGEFASEKQVEKVMRKWTGRAR
ncbi:MAG: ribbon-helix-helix protein, CopG family [Acidobacteriia bacterium]|nr:ribbon-helix-helix protein, CopG family [Terriglobia bacterium]